MVSPKAQSGAICGSRIPDSVSRLANIANSATPSVITLRTAVTAKVRSKISSDFSLMLA